jgi:hypothetical protein
LNQLPNQQLTNFQTSFEPTPESNLKQLPFQLPTATANTRAEHPRRTPTPNAERPRRTPALNTRAEHPHAHAERPRRTPAPNARAEHPR